VLLLLGALGLDLGVWLAEGRPGVPVDAIVIGAIVALNAALETVHGWRAERALDALEELAAPHSEVLRDGRWVVKPNAEIVPGDRILLTAGSRVPADASVETARGARLDVSNLTGESVPISVTAGDTAEAGTTLVAGRLEATVTATGANSALGRLAHLIGGIDRSPTPLQQRLSHFGRTVAVLALIIAALLTAGGVAAGERLADALLLAVALAVAAVPEGLPAVVTGALALGTQRMAKRNAVVRRLAAVETLGSVDVIAADKTGTLTENRMRLRRVVPALEGGGPGEPGEPGGETLLTAAVLASDGDPDAVRVDPIERALFDAASAHGVPAADVRDAHRVVDGRPFDAAWSFVRSTVETQGGEVSYYKGAPEALLKRCRLSDDDRRAWRDRASALTEQGERVLMVARENGRSERNLMPLGLLAFHDPPREGAKASVASVQSAGARMIMITGDHPNTARAIAQELGLPHATLASGDEVAARAEAGTLTDVDVFARTQPEKKLDVVGAHQQAGSAVAMTGDGVNDAPALRQADVGVAMGERGSDVAREAADLVLLDDDITTLVKAVEEGRNVAANLRAFVRFLFAANLAEVLAVSAAVVASWFAPGGSGTIVPLTASQILWINLMTDALPAFSLALDRRPELMQDPPRAARAALLSPATQRFVLLNGLLLAAVSLATYAWWPQVGLPPEAAPTGVFFILLFGQLTLIDAARRERRTPSRNRFLQVALGISLLLQAAAYLTPALRVALDLQRLPAAAWPAILLAVTLVWTSSRLLTRFTRPKAA
jgi:Ca2+-transporting ATPase